LQASILEAYKVLLLQSYLLIASFYLVSVIKAMLIGLTMVTLACVGMYFGNSFNMAKVLFATVGVSFALSPSTP
jgi:hypothetical protein